MSALKGVGFMVEPGTIHALIGPNGAGKTVLLNVLSGYYPPTQGRIRLRGEDITGLASLCGGAAGRRPHVPNRAAVRRA